ncbi:hypothetical protein Goklo_020562 [Gossypium klotzschianum]|uniref:Uncharacterized protein n=1 Tax=Gossypium klotzschianum TaxID=34286 RepID=A0A7J8US86_9ROSI|nr:hypothetical protein [Gossypium klotzschianum]
MEAPPDTDGLIVNVNGQKAKDDGHVVTKLVEEISLITLSDRVHQLIERKMAMTITIKLLGRKISFNSLLNKSCIGGGELVVKKWVFNNVRKRIFMGHRCLWSFGKEGKSEHKNSKN